jgi:hypothetical protein
MEYEPEVTGSPLPRIWSVDDRLNAGIAPTVMDDRGIAGSANANRQVGGGLATALNAQQHGIAVG